MAARPYIRLGPGKPIIGRAVLPFPEAARLSLLSRRVRLVSRLAKNALHPEEEFYVCDD